jgi:hypothetical protein
MNMSATTVIDRPAGDVLAYVLDVSHDPDWRTGVIASGMRSEGPMGIGSVGFARGRAGGKVLEAVWTVIEYVDGSLARWEFVSGPYAGTGGYVAQPVEGGTRFTLEADVRPTGLLRMLGPLFTLIGRRQNRADVATLKTILEG